MPYSIRSVDVPAGSDRSRSGETRRPSAVTIPSMRGGGGRCVGGRLVRIDHRHAETCRDPQTPVVAANAADAGLPRLRALLHAVGFVVERVLELVRRIRGDLVDFARMEPDHRRAGVHADPDVTLAVLDQHGHEIASAARSPA